MRQESSKPLAMLQPVLPSGRPRGTHTANFVKQLSAIGRLIYR